MRTHILLILAIACGTTATGAIHQATTQIRPITASERNAVNAAVKGGLKAFGIPYNSELLIMRTVRDRITASTGKQFAIYSRQDMRLMGLTDIALEKAIMARTGSRLLGYSDSKWKEMGSDMASKLHGDIAWKFSELKKIPVLRDIAVKQQSQFSNTINLTYSGQFKGARMTFEVGYDMVTGKPLYFRLGKRTKIER